MKLTYDTPLSTFAFNGFNSRPYISETIEALQAASGSGDREQRVVTLAAQAATARASEAALERRCAELTGDSQATLTRCARLEVQVAAAQRTAAAGGACTSPPPLSQLT